MRTINEACLEISARTRQGPGHIAPDYEASLEQIAAASRKHSNGGWFQRIPVVAGAVLGTLIAAVSFRPEPASHTGYLEKIAGSVPPAAADFHLEDSKVHITLPKTFRFRALASTGFQPEVPAVHVQVPKAAKAFALAASGFQPEQPAVQPRVPKTSQARILIATAPLEEPEVHVHLPGTAQTRTLAASSFHLEEPIVHVRIPAPSRAGTQVASLADGPQLGTATFGRLGFAEAWSRKDQFCLALAIYFEARSEPQSGQLAVARVILNREKSARYPDTICGVVFQGRHRRNSCQFSFACDRYSDTPRNPAAWRLSNRLAVLALRTSAPVQKVTTATHYHADYVSPRWSRSMTRLVKIGRHIFYRGT